MNHDPFDQDEYAKMNPHENQPPRTSYANQFRATALEEDAVDYDYEQTGPAAPKAEAPASETGQFSWENNVRRFPEDQLPSLSRSSIRLMEKNIRELLLVEGNLSAIKEDARFIYVTSCSDQEGKTISAVSTAFALATYAGKNVLLIDGHLKAPRIHNLFGTTVGPGFTEYCTGKIGLEEIILPTHHRGISIITSGEEEDFFQSLPPDLLTQKLDALRRAGDFDFVIFDGYSVMSSSQVSRAGRCFDIILLVVECEKTRLPMMETAEEKIRNNGGAAIGVVINRRKYHIPQTVYRLLSKKR